ncbi:synaptobrevin homolog YKT6-like, partial [Sagmatias obliquidens]|uniref:synaptobrevin homolog YKT6-like n=1 Tax=Sagmatias obliquidens TaxID=3371155 RepID=UPI000F43F3EE
PSSSTLLPGSSLSDEHSRREGVLLSSSVLQVLDEFSKQVDRIDWPVGSPDTIQYAGLDGHLSRYQNPREADPMTKVQAELDETKIILHNTMESLLERGEKLDDLVSKSEVLGIQSKAFYKTARKQNSCCAIM